MLQPPKAVLRDFRSFGFEVAEIFGSNRFQLPVDYSWFPM
jgi:hypothetical protein